MNKLLKATIASTSVALVGLAGITVPASGNESEAAGLSMSVVQTEVGSGASRTITWTVTVTDSKGRDFITSGTPTANQILIERSSSRACVSVPLAFSAHSLNSGDCESFFTRALANDASRRTASTGKLVYDLKSTDGFGGLGLSNYDNALASTRPYGAVVAYLRFSTDTGSSDNNLRWNLYGSTGNWTPTPVAGITTVAGVGGPTPAASSSDEQAPVAFAGALISRAERSIVGGTGSVTLFGKRLFTATSSTVGGLDVELTKTTRNGKFIVVSFEDLPAGSHDLVLHTTNGKITMRGAVKVN